MEAPWLTPPKKFKWVSSAGNSKVMASVFWDSQCDIMANDLEEGRTINGAYYAEEQMRLRQEIVKKRRGKLTRGFLLLQDNAPSHTSQVLWLLRLKAASRSFYIPLILQI